MPVTTCDAVVVGAGCRHGVGYRLVSVVADDG